MSAKTAAKILAGLLTVIVLALLAAPMFISADTLKAQLIAQVKKATGRTLAINGETSVRFFPNIAVTAEDVTLGNPDGFTSPYFVHIDKLATGAALKPLLNGELIITGITLDGPAIHAEELADGRKNWEFTAEKVQDAAEEAAEKPVAKTKDGGFIKQFAMGDITINNGAVSLIKPKAEVIALTAINATLQGADASRPLRLEFSANYREEQVSLALDVAKPREFLQGDLSPLTVALKLPGASVDFNGEAAQGKAIKADGKIAFSSAALPKVMAWATGQQASPSLPKQVNLRGDLGYAGTKASLKNASLRADSLSAEGNLAIDHGGSKPSISGTLKTDLLDLDALLPKGGEAQASKARTGAPAAEGWSSDPIDLSGLNAVNADLGLELAGIRKGALEVGATNAQVKLNGGNLVATIAQAALYQGAAKGVVRASSSGIGADLDFSSIAIEPLMEALAGQSRLTGSGSFGLNVIASGNNMRSWMQSLNGNGKLSLRDGAVKGINIGRFLRDAKQGFLFKSENEATDFSEFGASFTIAQGVLSNSDLAMKSPALRLTGAGSANLAAKSVNYRLLPTLAGTSKGQGGKDDVTGISIPLVITGPWSNPSVTPDLAGMVEEGLRDPEKLKQNLKGIKDTIGDYNSADDLKRALLGGKNEEAAPVATDATSTAEPAAAPSKREQRDELIKQGIGGLLKGL